MAQQEDNPFAALQALRDALPPGPAAAPPVGAPASDKAPRIARAVVRMQRKGHGGKTVTAVEKLALPEGELDVLLKELKGQLGLGGRREGDVLVLQGDCRERVAAHLTKIGVRKVTVA